MLLKTVRIKNFREIKERTVELKPGFNFISGKDEKEKTAILEAIAIGLSGFTVDFQGVKARNFTKEDVRFSDLMPQSKIDDKEVDTSTEIVLKAVLSNDVYEWMRSKNRMNVSRGTIQPRDICKHAVKMASDIGNELPILAYYGSNRFYKQDDSLEIFRKDYFRTVGYVDALLDTFDIKMLLNWCTKMEVVAWQKRKKIAEYEAVRKAVSDFLYYFESNENYAVFYDKHQEKMMCQKDDKIFAITDFDKDYQAIIWMVFDIAYRMAVLNPFMKENITQTAGIVLIDEMDRGLSLYDKERMEAALQKVFSNVQFIVATNS